MQRPARAGFFDGEDGVKLYGEWYLPAPRRPLAGGAVIVHGYADHCGRYGELAGRLAGTGLMTLAFDYRGHGQAGGRRGHCDRFDDYLADLRSACARLRDDIGEGPLVLVAHGLGGLIAMRLLTAAQPPAITPAALVLSSPAVTPTRAIPALGRRVAGAAARLVPRFSLANRLDAGLLSHDAHMVVARAGDRFCHHRVTVRCLAEVIDAQREVRASAARLTVPSLWLLAGADRVADPRATRAVFERAGGDKHLVWYDGFFHEVFNEQHRARVFRDLEAWLSVRVPTS